MLYLVRLRRERGSEGGGGAGGGGAEGGGGEGGGGGGQGGDVPFGEHPDSWIGKNEYRLRRFLPKTVRDSSFKGEDLPDLTTDS